MPDGYTTLANTISKYLNIIPLPDLREITKEIAEKTEIDYSSHEIRFGQITIGLPDPPTDIALYNTMSLLLYKTGYANRLGEPSISLISVILSNATNEVIQSQKQQLHVEINHVSEREKLVPFRKQFSFENCNQLSPRETNSVYAFIQDLLEGKVEGYKAEKCEGCRTESVALYNLYVKWCNNEGINPLLKRLFTIEMKKLGFRRVKIHAHTYYKGINLVEKH